MGYHAKLSADRQEAVGDDAVQLSRDALRVDAAVIAGYALCDGKVIAYTLDTRNFATEPCKIVPEQIAIAALLLASFIAPIRYFLA